MLTPLPVFHMNAMAYSTMAMATTGGCLIVLDPLPSEELVGERPGRPRDRRALSRRDAADPHASPGLARGSRPCGPLRLRRGC